MATDQQYSSATCTRSGDTASPDSVALTYWSYSSEVAGPASSQRCEKKNVLKSYKIGHKTFRTHLLVESRRRGKGGRSRADIRGWRSRRCSSVESHNTREQQYQYLFQPPTGTVKVDEAGGHGSPESGSPMRPSKPTPGRAGRLDMFAFPAPFHPLNETSRHSSGH